MTPLGTRMAWATSTVALAALASYGVSRWSRPAPADFHTWMHDQLDLSPEQNRALHAAEAAYEAERAALEKEIAAGGRDLSEALRTGNARSTQVKAALDRLNAAQAALRTATLHHFFDMKEHLDPDQAEKLLRWTHERLLPH